MSFKEIMDEMKEEQAKILKLEKAEGEKSYLPAFIRFIAKEKGATEEEAKMIITNSPTLLKVSFTLA